MEGFLRRLCDIACGPSIQEKTSCTKILITTRPTVEVDNAAIGREVVLEIQESDTKAAVGKFVEDGVRHLGQLKQLSSPAQDFIREEITQKSGHVFQTAQTALRRLRSECYDLEIREVVSRALARVNSQKSDDAYEETLEILESAPLQDQVKAARIVRILFFSQNKLSLLELEHALLVDVHGSEPILKPAPVQSTLGVFIRTYLALLVKIDNDSMVSLQHQTIREYFQSLSGDRWQIYSCAERKGGHLQLALICIGHMVLWRGHAVTQEDIDAHKGNEILARMDKVTFLRYASYYWDLHTKEAGDLIIPHMPLVDKLLGIHSNQSYNDYYLPMLDLRRSQGLDTRDKYQDFFPLLPVSFLATNDLLHVLRGHTWQRKVQKRGLARRMMFWTSQAVNSDTIEADFDLNEQDKNGLGSTPLHCACRNGHLETAKLLLDCGASGEVYDADRNSPFSMAVEGNWEEMAEMLITRNQCWDDPEKGGKSVTLHMACFFGMSKVVQHLLGIGYDVNAQDLDGGVPIHCATRNNQTDTLEVLLKAGGLPDLKTNFGNTPLHLAARDGFLAVIQMLFRYKSDMDPIPIRSDGGSPHHAAAACGHLEVFKYLEAKCKDVRPDEDGNLPIHLAAYGGYLPIVNHLSDISNITAMDKNKRLPIHYAAANGQLETVQRLLQLGRKVGLSVDVKCRDLSVTVEESSDGLLTPLYLAVALGHQKTAEYLINEGADPNVRSFRNQTLLHEAVRNNTSEIFELLLKHHLDPFEANETLETPLHMAAALGNSDIVEIYLGMQDIRAGLDMVDTDGDSALALAIQNSHAQISGKLVSKGANVHLLDRDQSSTLMLSLELEEMTVFERLLEEGVDVNVADAFGDTALHAAAIYGRLDACETLIKRGANINAERLVTKVTPLHCAGKRNNVDIVLRLLNAGADPFKRELSGASIMDYVTTYQPMLDLLRRYRKDYRPESNEGQPNALRQVFCATLRALPLTAPTDQAGKLKFRVLFGTLLYVSWNLKEYDIYRVCEGDSIDRSANSTPIWPYRCDNCHRRNVEGSPWVCKQCPATHICSECYEKRSEGLYARGCSVDHEYLEILGEEWGKLEEGKVNAKGQTLWEWIAELKETHLTGDDDELEDSTQHRKKVPVIQVSGAV